MNTFLPLRFYQVRPPETLDDICTKFNVSQDKIERDKSKSINDPLEEKEMLVIRNF